jgi:hypothetical protein
MSTHIIEVPGGEINTGDAKGAATFLTLIFPFSSTINIL